MHQLAVLAILAVTWTQNWWTLSWNPHPDNRFIRLIYECVDPHEASKKTFRALNVFEVQPGIRRMDIRRLPLPEKQHCIVVFDVVRHADIVEHGRTCARMTAIGLVTPGLVSGQHAVDVLNAAKEHAKHRQKPRWS